eukprot:7378954-Prymnesium_polylepis.2
MARACRSARFSVPAYATEPFAPARCDPWRAQRKLGSGWAPNSWIRMGEYASPIRCFRSRARGNVSLITVMYVSTCEATRRRSGRTTCSRRVSTTGGASSVRSRPLMQMATDASTCGSPTPTRSIKRRREGAARGGIGRVGCAAPGNCHLPATNPHAAGPAHGERARVPLARRPACRDVRPTLERPPFHREVARLRV